MEYMFVFQWPTSPKNNYDLMISLEEAVTAAIEDLGTVDGHDIGSGEMNIFVFTEQLQRAFERIKSIPEIVSNLNGLKVGFRVIGREDYKPLYPEGLKQFSVK